MTTFSNYQAAVIKAVKVGRVHTVVDAKAGAGKSFTILSAAAALSASNALNGGTLMLAFNKDIAAELAKKAKDRGIAIGGYGGVTIKTFHALGFGAWRNYMGRTKVQIDDKKSWNILNYAGEVNEAWDDEFIREYGSVAVKLVAYAKNAGVGCIIDGVSIDNTPAVFEGIFHHHNMELSTVDSNLDDAIELAMWLLDESAQVTRFIDYNDMLWLPVYYRASFFKNQRVFVDELQDTNPLQLEIAVRSLKNSGQFIGVGDPNQAIYGFRGADSNATKLSTDSVVLIPMLSTRLSTASKHRFFPSQSATVAPGPSSLKHSVSCLPSKQHRTLSKARWRRFTSINLSSSRLTIWRFSAGTMLP
jgi:superfamily I DNA/RNA helicase